MKTKKNIVFYFFIMIIFIDTSCTAQRRNKKEPGNNSNNSVQTKGLSKDELIKNENIAGIFVASQWQKPIDDYVLQNSNVDGVFLRMQWAPMQPEKGKYDWALLDSEVKRIATAGKKISIGVMAGSRTPEWVYNEGVPSLNFTEIPLEGKSENAINIKIPVPWNEKYLQIWTGFIKAMADHLKTDPKSYNAISIIKITGINENTIEIRLPSQSDLSNQKTKTTDAPAIWKNAGYRPKLILKAWEEITNSFAINFNDKYFSIGIIAANRAFPTVDDSGNIINREQSHDITEDLITEGIKKYNGKFIVQFNALNQTHVNQKMIAPARQQGALIGYQLNQRELANPACLEGKGSCDEKMFQSILENGMGNGAYFIEIFPKNVKAYPNSIKNVHLKLKPQN